MTPILLVVAVLLAACSSGSDAEKDAGGAPTTVAGGTTDGSSGGDGPSGTDADCDWSIEAPSTTFIVDRCGRAVILRGVNVESSSKGDSQDDDHFPASDPALQEKFGTEWGWNSVRFLVFWGAIEPEKGVYDENYLDEVEAWVDRYEAMGIHVVLDMHQDLYGWTVGFDGAPDWAVDTQGHPIAPPANEGAWWLRGADPAVQAAYQAFWNPADGDTELQDHYLGALKHLAERFADHPAVIGYDVMNEPAFANGDLNATLAIAGQAEAGEFHNENLTNFMNRGIAAIREVSPDQYVFVEPTSLINYFPYEGDLIEDDIVDPREGQPRLVYAGHLYEPTVHEGEGYPTESTYVDEWFDLRPPEAEAMSAALWFGEWGGAPDQDRMDVFVEDVLSAADRTMSGWAWWSWDPGGWSPIDGDGEVSANGVALRRVQPRAVAGLPTSFAWDPDEQVFTLAWTPNPKVTAPTEIAVPASLFADGFVVVLDGEEIADPEHDAATSTLRIPSDAGVAGGTTSGAHELCIAPAGSTACT